MGSYLISENMSDERISAFEEILMRFSPVWASLRQNLTPRELLILSITSKRLRSVTSPLVTKVQDIQTSLQAFVKDTSSFRLMLKDTGGVIAGEFARAFFLGQAPLDTMTIVIVDPRFYSGVKMTRWLRYLSRREGYKQPSIKVGSSERGAQVMSNYEVNNQT